MLANGDRKGMEAALPEIMGQPEDIGNAAVFLASDSASYLTVATLPVSGGIHLKVMAG